VDGQQSAGPRVLVKVVSWTPNPEANVSAAESAGLMLAKSTRTN